jgi:hypothetical protein
MKNHDLEIERQHEPATVEPDAPTAPDEYDQERDDQLTEE